MEFLTVLWLPILLSAVFVFAASSVLHMLLPYHKSDYRKLPGEENILELRLFNGTSEEPSPTDPDNFYKMNFRSTVM